MSGEPVETPDSNGSVRRRVRRSGRVAKTNDITIIETGIASAKQPHIRNANQLCSTGILPRRPSRKLAGRALARARRETAHPRVRQVLQRRHPEGGFERSDDVATRRSMALTGRPLT